MAMNQEQDFPSDETVSDTENALHQAAGCGDVARVVSFLVSGAGSNTPIGAAARTPLMAAAEAGHTEITRRLLEYGADVNAKNIFGETALTLAAIEGHTEVAMVLLDWGADVNIADESGETPLLNAAWGEHEDTLRLLLKRGADPDVTGGAGQTAMTIAISHDRNNILAILLAGGADPNLGHGNLTPLMMAILDGEAVRLLLAHGADITLRDRHGKTALQHAFEDCAHDAVPLLKAAGAKV